MRLLPLSTAVVLFSTTGQVALASPVVSPAATTTSPNKCGLVSAVVSCLHGWSAASSYCTSFLSITTSTISTTIISPPAVVVVPTTTTVTTFTITPAIVTSIVSTDTTVTVCTTVAAQKNKRAGNAAATTKKCTTSSTTAKAPSTTSKAPTTMPKASSTTTKTSINLPASISTFVNSQISSGCSCIVTTPSTTTTITSVAATPSTTTTVSTSATITLTTSTTTTTTTNTVMISTTCSVLLAPTSCNNQGLQYAVFYNDQGDNTDYTTYSNYDPTYMKAVGYDDGEGATPYYTAVTTTIGGIDDTTCNGQDISIYGSSDQFPCNYFSISHRGYIFAAQSGTYTFTATQTDDILFIWFGSNAVSGWTRANANMFSSYGGPYQDATGTVALTQGEYLPIRIIFGQAQEAAIFQLSVTDPSGNVIFDSNSTPSNYLVQYSCDQTTAPPYPYTFGQEH